MSTPNPASTEWVPLWNLNGGIDLRYRGDWAAGSYMDGDIVVYAGIAYMCVRPTSAVPAAWSPPQTTPGYGTSLPSNPVNGQEHVLVDSLTAPTYQWRFRYNANSTSTYKWEFVGGTLVHVEVIAAISTGSGSFVDVGGPSFAIPRAGDYNFGIGGQVQGIGALSPNGAGLTATDDYSVTWAATGTGFSMNMNVWSEFRRNGLTTGTVSAFLRLISGSASSQRTRLRIQPVRVS